MTRKVTRGFIPARLTALRIKRNLKVADLARLARAGTSTVYAWELGRRSPQVDVLARVMKVLDAPISAVVVVERRKRFPGDWRVLAGLTQPGLAAKAGITTSNLKLIERAESELTDKNAEALGRALGITGEVYRAAHARARRREPGTPA